MFSNHTLYGRCLEPTEIRQGRYIGPDLLVSTTMLIACQVWLIVDPLFKYIFSSILNTWTAKKISLLGQGGQCIQSCEGANKFPSRASRLAYNEQFKTVVGCILGTKMNEGNPFKYDESNDAGSSCSSCSNASIWKVGAAISKELLWLAQLCL